MQDHHGWVDAGWSEARRAGDRGARRSFERGFWAMVALLWWAGLVDAAREVAGCAGEVRQVLIAEAMASNHRTLLDEDGDSSDWVELQNLSDDPVSLKGWQLTDAPARAGRWTLGDLVLPPRGRQVIFCSGKDRQVPPEAGPAPRAPDTVPGLAMWFDAGTINPADTNQVVARAGRRFVRRWESRAPLSLSVDQAHEPSQPEWGADVLGGRPAVKFTDSVAGLASQPISGSVFAPAQECTVLVVQNCQNAPGFFGATVLWQSNPTNWLALLAVWANGNFYFDLGNAYLGGRLNYPAPDDFREHWFVLSATRHGEKRAELHLNGHLHVSQPVRTDFDPSGSAPFRVGLQGFTGWIAELLVFHRALESDERASLEAHLGQKYGLAVRRLEWHANFELNSDGEVLQLYTPSGQLADTLVLQRAPTDVAQGRSEDLAVSGLLRQPTPGFVNSEVAYQGQALAPGLSHASGFHGGPFTLRLENAEPDALARYTLDGSEPGPESPVWPGELQVDATLRPPDSLRWIPTNPAHHVTASGQPSMPDEQRGIFGWLPPESSGPGPLVVSVRVFRDGYLPSDTAVATFFIGTDTLPPPSLPVATLAVEPGDLFDPATGLYVPGNDYDPALWSGRFWWGTGNYFRRGAASERVARFSFFVEGQAPQLEQDAGLRIHGGGTRAQPMKSLTLLARQRLGPERFTFSYLADSQTAYERLVLRNSGQDSVLRPTLLRHALASRLAQARDPTVARSEPCLLYLNGEYWGLHHLTEDYGPHYFSKWGITERNLDYLDDGHVSAGDAWSYYEMIERALSRPLAVPENYDDIVRRLDPEAFVEYLIAELYLANADWPHNHINSWRVRQPATVPTPGREADGRWRWLLTDLDGTLGLGGPAEDDSLGRLLDQGPTSMHLGPLLHALLLNGGFRSLFLNRFADRLNADYGPETVRATLDRLAVRMRPAMSAHAARWRRPVSLEAWERELDVVGDFVARRPARLREHLDRRFDLGGEAEVTVRIQPPGAGWLHLNSLRLGGGNPPPLWRGRYFRHLPVEIVAEAASGYRFGGWEGLEAGTAAATQVALSSDVALVARFEPDADAIQRFEPAPHDLAQAPFVFNSWSADATAGSYPNHLRFLQADQKDPTLTDWEGPLLPWTLGYALTSRSRFLGLGTNGLGLINTSSVQTTPGAGYVGAVVLALDTRGVTQAFLSWTAGTMTASARPHALRAQWRVGDAGAFLDWPAAGPEDPWEVRADPMGEKAAVQGPWQLPEAALGQPYVQVRWVYHAEPTNRDGPRPLMRLDDIVVTRLPLPAAYLVWLADQPSSGPVISYEDGSPESDLDADGTANFMEYVSGTNPLRPESLPAWRIRSTDRQVEFLWPVNPQVEQASYRLEESEDLRAWRPTGWHDRLVYFHADRAWRLARRLEPADVVEPSTRMFLRVWAGPVP